jgi:succinate dehydrogenase/fumarate reductase flavoprotein subunit
MGQVVEADLLVIGAGGAGCVAAIEGKRQGARVAAAIAREVREGKGTKFGGCILDLTENRKDPEYLYHFKTRRKIRLYQPSLYGLPSYPRTGSDPYF